MLTHLRGAVHGQTIVLTEDCGLPDGQQVTVLVRPATVAASPSDPSALAGLRRAAGAWAGDDEDGLAEFLEWNRQQRKTGRILPE